MLRAPATTGEHPLLAEILKQIHETILIHRFQRRNRGACFGTNTWNFTAEEEAEARVRSELPDSPRTADVVSDAPDDDTTQCLAANGVTANDPRRTHPVPRWSG
jgi:hypothetical protein